MRFHDEGWTRHPFAAKSEPGKGDDIACEACHAVALDTGLECSECGHDNYASVTGKPFSTTKIAAAIRARGEGK